MPITTPWTTVVPDLRAGTTIGNGAVLARHRRRDGEFQFALGLTAGSTTTFTTAQYFDFSVQALPNPGITWDPAAVLGTPSEYVVPAFASIDSGSTSWASGVARVELNGVEGTTLYTSVRIWPLFATSLMSSTVPFTWTSGSRLVLGNAIEAFDN